MTVLRKNGHEPAALYTKDVTRMGWMHGYVIAKLLRTKPLRLSACAPKDAIRLNYGNYHFDIDWLNVFLWLSARNMQRVPTAIRLSIQNVPLLTPEQALLVYPEPQAIQTLPYFSFSWLPTGYCHLDIERLPLEKLHLLAAPTVGKVFGVHVVSGVQLVPGLPPVRLAPDLPYDFFEMAQLKAILARGLSGPITPDAWIAECLRTYNATLDVPAVANKLGVYPWTVRRLVRKGLLTAYIPPNKGPYRILTTSLDERV